VYAVNFSESEANRILAVGGITNAYVYQIERDSRGDRLFAYFSEVGRRENRGVLIVTASQCIITNFPNATGPVGLREDLTKAYSLEGDRYVFAGGRPLPVRGKTKNSWLSVIGAPGNEVLALSYYDDPDYIVVHSSDPQKPLFHLDAKKEIPVKRIFYRDSTIFVFGTVYDTKARAHWECWTYRAANGTWECNSRVTIPDADEVLDLDPESPNVLCYRRGMIDKKAFAFNLDTKVTSNIGFTIWRDHGYFLRDGVVARIKVTLSKLSVPK